MQKVSNSYFKKQNICSLLILSDCFLLGLLLYKSLVSKSVSIESLSIRFVISSSDDESSDMAPRSESNKIESLSPDWQFSFSLTRRSKF